MADQWCEGETLIEHFEKCVPGGKEALDKARRELIDEQPLIDEVKRRVRKRKDVDAQP